jgi:hypothetical protein
MRTRKILLLCGVLFISGAFAALSLTWGQEASPAPATKPATLSVPLAITAPVDRTPRDLARLSPLQRQMYLSAQSGADWLRRANRADGRFLAGYVPALKTPLEGDHYLRQAAAAFALARAAAFLGDQRLTAIARQAVLTLLLDTATDATEPQVRHTALPSVVVNRLASAGLLVLAINELPAPGVDVLEQSEQLCAFIRKQQMEDGSLRCTDAAGQTEVDPDAIHYYPGEALYGLMRSQRYRPAAWKTDTVRRALPFYQKWWRTHQTLALIPWQTAAYAEAYLLTSEKPFADFVTEMNDWICDKQYQQLDPRHPLWIGGFMEWSDGRALSVAPQINTAYFAEGLAEACRLTRRSGDVARYQSYRDTLERALQFLATLQYTEGNTQHYADWYRPALLGAFHASHQDGNLRLDYSQHAVCAMLRYLEVTGE